MWAAAAGSVIGGSNQLIAAYLQHRDAKKQRQEQKKARREQSFAYRMEMARKYGIHPLAMLGVDIAAPWQNVFDESYNTLARAGQDIGKGVGQGLQTIEDREIYNQGIEREKAQTRLLNAQTLYFTRKANELYQAPIRSTGDPLTDSLNAGGQYNAAVTSQGGQSGVTVVPDQQTAQRAPGVSAGPGHPTMKWAIFPNPKGPRWVPTLTQEFTESMEDDLRFKIQKYSNDISVYFQGYMAAFGGVDSKAGQRWMGFWKKYLPQLPRGQYWHYATAGGYFYVNKTPPKYFRPSGERPGIEFPGLKSPRSWERLKRRY